MAINILALVRDMRLRHDKSEARITNRYLRCCGDSWLTINRRAASSKMTANPEMEAEALIACPAADARAVPVVSAAS